MDVLRREKYIVQKRESEKKTSYISIHKHKYTIHIYTYSDFNYVTITIRLKWLSQKKNYKNYKLADVAIYRFSPTGVLREDGMRITDTHTHTPIYYINKKAEEVRENHNLTT